MNLFTFRYLVLPTPPVTGEKYVISHKGGFIWSATEEEVRTGMERDIAREFPQGVLQQQLDVERVDILHLLKRGFQWKRLELKWFFKSLLN